MRAPPLASLALALAASCGGADDGVGDGAVDAGRDAAVDAGALNADPCPPVAPACPTLPAGYGLGDGLRAIDRCGFPLAERDTWAVRAAIVDALPPAVPRVTLADIAGDLNRAATPVTAAQLPGDAPGVRSAFAWQAGDRDVAYWIPQGLTGSFDGVGGGLVAGRRLLLVSWYHDRAAEPGATADKGVRIAIVDVTDPAAVRYRFALLVDPVVKDGRSDFDPVAVHAGGLAWFGDYLYVPDTGNGLRVFDLSRIVAVDTPGDRLGYDPATGGYQAHGYRYVIPQVDTYLDDGACAPRFSYVAVDRSTTPPSLISGEYDAATFGGRLFRWPLDAASGRLQRTDRGRVVPAGAWYLGQTHVQGAASRDGVYWLSSSAPAGGAGALYRVGVGVRSTTLGWIDGPEDLAVDAVSDSLWGLSEAASARYVMAVARAAID